jgi:hypothetical protein
MKSNVYTDWQCGQQSGSSNIHLESSKKCTTTEHENDAGRSHEIGRYQMTLRYSFQQCSHLNCKCNCLGQPVLSNTTPLKYIHTFSGLLPTQITACDAQNDSNINYTVIITIQNELLPTGRSFEPPVMSNNFMKSIKVNCFYLVTVWPIVEAK